MELGANTPNGHRMHLGPVGMLFESVRVGAKLSLTCADGIVRSMPTKSNRKMRLRANTPNVLPKRPSSLKYAFQIHLSWCETFPDNVFR